MHKIENKMCEVKNDLFAFQVEINGIETWTATEKLKSDENVS